jgi:hypothetical protein
MFVATHYLAMIGNHSYGIPTREGIILSIKQLAKLTVPKMQHFQLIILSIKH